MTERTPADHECEPIYCHVCEARYMSEHGVPMTESTPADPKPTLDASTEPKSQGVSLGSERTPADGVAVWEWEDAFGPRYDDYEVRDAVPGVWRPVEDDERRVDVSDPAVIERAERAAAYCIGRDFPSEQMARTILAAIRRGA